MATVSNDDFRLSRIEAEGWNMAQKYMPGQSKKPDEFQVADLNPHPRDPARHRWATGFNKAVASMYAS